MQLKSLTRFTLLATLTMSSQAFAEISCNYSYGIQTTVNGSVGQTYCSSKSQELIDYVKDWKSTNLNYTNTSAADVVGRFNDVDITMSYAANSNTLKFSAPEIGIENKEFTGATRNESQDMFVDWLKHDSIIGDIMRYQAKHSATSPITGSGGLMPTLASTDYETGMQGSSNINSNTNIVTSTGNVLGIGASFSSYSVDGSADNVESATLPLSYTNQLDNKPNHQIIFSLPISMYQVGKAKGYHVGFGVAYRFPN